jgi:hypothetical protein
MNGPIDTVNWQSVEGENPEDAAKAALTKGFEFFRYLGAITAVVVEDNGQDPPTKPGSLIHAIRLAWDPYQKEGGKKS